jgi:hypothetical protein
MRLESVAGIGMEEEEQNLSLINKDEEGKQEWRTWEGSKREERGFKFL